MCLAIPGKLLTRLEHNGVLSGLVQFGGIVREVCLDFLPEAEIGDYILVHVGFALSRVDPEQARLSYQTLASMGVIQSEFDSDVEPVPPTSSV